MSVTRTINSRNRVVDWKKPKDEHIVYEALSAIADRRFRLITPRLAKCTSTSRGKSYEVEYDQASKSIMSNDNMAYYRNEVSYTMVAMLLMKGEIDYDETVLEYLKDIKWKDINQKNKNDYMKSVAEVMDTLAERGADVQKIKNQVSEIYRFICSMKLRQLGAKKAPPNAY